MTSQRAKEFLDQYWAPCVGVVLWAAWAVMFRPEWTAIVLLLSPFVLVPLGMRLAAQPVNGPNSPVLPKLRELTLPGAVFAAISFLPEPGLLAAVLSLPWLIITMLIAAIGGLRLISRRTLAEATVGVDVGLLFLAVGALWMTLSRGGLNPLGFSDTIVRLTSVHFHFAGFALPLVAGIAARRLQNNAVIPLAATIGVPVTAVGIMVGGIVETVAATAMAIAGLAVARSIFQLSTVGRGIQPKPTLAQRLLVVSGTALTAGMLLALAYAWMVWFEIEGLSIELMARTHGSINAIGFGMLGLIALNMAAEAQPRVTRRTGMHLGRPSADVLGRLQERAEDFEPVNAVGLLERPLQDGYRKDTWTVLADDFDNSCEALWNWAGHEAAGIALFPERPRIARGGVLALSIPLGPIAASATCQIVDIINEEDRYGFVYSTLPHHPVSGEEMFVVSTEDGQARVTVTAVWRPATVATSIFPPLTRFLQGRAINRYMKGIADAEAAVIGAYLDRVLSDVDNRQFPTRRPEPPIEDQLAAPIRSTPER